MSLQSSHFGVTFLDINIALLYPLPGVCGREAASAGALIRTQRMTPRGGSQGPRDGDARSALTPVRLTQGSPRAAGTQRGARIRRYDRARLDWRALTQAGKRREGSDRVAS